MAVCGYVFICQVRDETETRIDVPPEGSDVTVITVSGPKDNVDKAREMLESTQKALVSSDSAV